MDKASRRVFWEDEPSFQTPLESSLLNREDKSTDIIDDRTMHLDERITRLEYTEDGFPIVGRETIVFEEQYWHPFLYSKNAKDRCEKYDPSTRKVLVNLVTGRFYRVELCAIKTKPPIDMKDPSKVLISSPEKVKEYLRNLDTSNTLPVKMGIFVFYKDKGTGESAFNIKPMTNIMKTAGGSKIEDGNLSIGLESIKLPPRFNKDKQKAYTCTQIYMKDNRSTKPVYMNYFNYSYFIRIIEY